MATIDEMAGGDIQERDRLRREQGRNRPDMQAEPPTPDPAYRGPGMDIDASKMGGALDDGNSVIEIGPDMKPRRVPRAPGPQSDAGSFGSMLAGTDAEQLVKLVRQDRLARQAAGQQTPTFGELGEQNRMEQAAQAQAGPPQASPEEEQARIQQIAKSIRFVVDTKTGEFEPVLPDQPDPQIGPNDIFIALGDDPTMPNILAQGKRVTSADVARLGDPKRAMQPALRSTYKVPEQYAGLAEALGLKAEGQG